MLNVWKWEGNSLIIYCDYLNVILNELEWPEVGLFINEKMKYNKNPKKSFIKLFNRS